MQGNFATTAEYYISITGPVKCSATKVEDCCLGHSHYHHAMCNCAWHMYAFTDILSTVPQYSAILEISAKNNSRPCDKLIHVILST